MELGETVSILESVEFFGICDTEELKLLAFASERRTFMPGEVIYNYGDDAEGAYVLHKGIVTAADDPNRPHKTYSVRGPGALIGEMGLLLNRPHRATITAVTNVDTLYVPRSAFNKLIRQSPEMAQKAVERIEAELKSYLGSFENFRVRARNKDDQ